MIKVGRKATPGTKLPRLSKDNYIQPAAKGEILYKSEEYVDEFVNGAINKNSIMIINFPYIYELI